MIAFIFFACSGSDTPSTPVEQSSQATFNLLVMPLKRQK